MTNNLDKLLTEVRNKILEMQPHELAKLRNQQRKSWVVGEMMLAHNELTYSEACKLYEEATK